MNAILSFPNSFLCLFAIKLHIIVYGLLFSFVFRIIHSEPIFLLGLVIVVDQNTTNYTKTYIIMAHTSRYSCSHVLIYYVPWCFRCPTKRNMSGTAHMCIYPPFLKKEVVAYHKWTAQYILRMVTWPWSYDRMIFVLCQI